jgi:hypothetical protein
MFGKLKNAVAEGAIKSAIDSYADRVSLKLEEVTKLNASDVSDNQHYHTYVIAPALTAVIASAGGATKLIPNFEQRFAKALLHTRDQLVIVDTANNKVSLVQDYKSRISDVLIEGFRQDASNA